MLLVAPANTHNLPYIMQIRFHPYNYVDQKTLVEFSTKHGIITAAYSGLTCASLFILITPKSARSDECPLYRPITKTPGGPVDKPIAAAAKRIGGTPAQAILLWIRSKGVAIVT